MQPLTSPAQSYLYKPRTGARAFTYLIIVWIVSIFLFQEVSDNFFANIKNPLNQYFVKYAWGWTLYPLSCLVALSSLSKQGTILNTRSVHIFCRLVLCTAVWYSFAVVLFPHVEQATGVCEVSGLLTKRECRKNGFSWRGFDISGHCFLLTWNNLVIIEETKFLYRTKEYKEKQTWLDLGVKLVHGLLCVLLLLWEVMMFCTSLYFHTTTEKLLGTLCAILPWVLIYRVIPTLYSMTLGIFSQVTLPTFSVIPCKIPGASWLLSRLD